MDTHPRDVVLKAKPRPRLVKKKERPSIAEIRKLRARYAGYEVKSWSDDFEAYNRAKFEETGNPLFVWEVIGAATGSNGQERRFTIPQWCTDYLAEVSARIFALSNGKDCRMFEADDAPFPDDVTPDTATKLLPSALGFESQGFNAFKERAALNRACVFFAEHHSAKSRGMSDTDALRHVQDTVGKYIQERRVRDLIEQGRKFYASVKRAY